MLNVNPIVFYSEFDDEFYNSEIEKRKLELNEICIDKNLEYKLIRRSTNIAKTSSSITYNGDHDVYQIIDKNSILGHLHCYKSIRYNHFEISFYPKKD